MILALTAAAFAAPRFDADLAADAEIAEKAWAAAVVCAGREPEHHEVVRIERAVIPGGWRGRAHVDAAHRLTRIDLSAPEDRIGEVLAHEVSHAWVSDGDHALVEGAAELLADCVAAQMPGLVRMQFDDGRELVTNPDLRGWSIAAEGRPLAMDGARTDAYLGAARLLRTASLVVGATSLWRGEPVTWEGLEASLVAQGPAAQAVLDVVRADPLTQRQALDDADRDGLTALAEALLGTDPSRFDTTGDGWWDGAQPPPGAVPIPLDGTPTCLGGVASAEVVLGGNLRGHHLPELVATDLAAGALVALRGETYGSSGGAWAWAAGARETEGCASSTRRTVAAADAALVPAVAPLGAALDALLPVADARLGPSPRRVAVVLGGDVSSFDGQVVRLSEGTVQGALSRGELRALAAWAIGAVRVWGTEDASAREAEAVGRSLLR